jgi:hypothetical protein
MDIEQEIVAIKERNERVGFDKAWERSWTRRLTIAGLTYIFAVIWLYTIGNQAPLLNGFIPVVGFLLSTLTLAFLKRRWTE